MKSAVFLEIPHSAFMEPGPRNPYDPRPFFMSEHETALLMENEELSRWLSPSLRVSRELLMQAIEEVECLCAWLEERLNAVRYSAARSS